MWIGDIADPQQKSKKVRGPRESGVCCLDSCGCRIIWMACPKLDPPICARSYPVARTQFTLPTQLPCFFAAKMQKIEEAVGALDVLEDVTNVGAAREKRVDGCNEFALIRKDTLASFGVDAAARSPRADARDITAALAIAFKNAQEMHQVSAPRGMRDRVSAQLALIDRSERGAGFGLSGQEQCGCSAAQGCRAGWRRARRQS